MTESGVVCHWKRETESERVLCVNWKGGVKITG